LNQRLTNVLRIPRIPSTSSLSGRLSGSQAFVPDVDPRRAQDYPAEERKIRIKKRIIVCCDGTWDNGLIANERWKYTNILKLARSINHVDERSNPGIPQLVFYQSGIATEDYSILRTLDGAVGATLADKVQEAYGFLAHNYQPGDEICLFGFSRGAYTARMVAQFIGAIGILSRTDMDHFADIFVAYQKRGQATDEDDLAALDRQLEPWTNPQALGKRRVSQDPRQFSIQCVGVFETVGAVGLPEELTHKSPPTKTIFGFPNMKLGEHIARAYQAIGMNENRKDFDIAKFEQTEGGRRKGQILNQCWFAGAHADIGGSYEQHDLSDITLAWLTANIGDILSLDYTYLASLPDPVAPWGAQAPHDSATGVFALAATIHRQLPTETNNITHETIHPSVMRQHTLNKTLLSNLQNNPSLVAKLLPLEEDIKNAWKVSPQRSQAYENQKDHPKAHPRVQDQRSPLAKIIGEHSMGAVIREVI